MREIIKNISLKSKNILGGMFSKIFNKRYVVSAIATILFALCLKLFYTQLLGLDLSVFKLNVENISFSSLVVLFRIAVLAIFDEYTLSATPGSHSSSTQLLMADKDEVSPSSSGTRKVGSAHAEEVLTDDMHNTLKSMFSIVHEIERYKMTEKVTLTSSKEDLLEVDAPRGMSEQRGVELGNRIIDLDATFKADDVRYKKLMQLDKLLHNSQFGPNLEGQYIKVSKRYKDLFEQEK